MTNDENTYKKLDNNIDKKIPKKIINLTEKYRQQLTKKKQTTWQSSTTKPVNYMDSQKFTKVKSSKGRLRATLLNTLKFINQTI